VDLDRYIARHSPIHRADARVKFIATIVFIVAVALLPTAAWIALALAWLGVIVATMAAKLGPLLPARRAIIAFPFVLAAFPLIFTRPEDPIGQVNILGLTLTISGEGLRIFVTIALKSWISLQAALLLAFTTPFHELIDGLRELRMPRLLVAIISFTYRYLGVLSTEATRMSRAKASRSAYIEGRGGGSIAWRARVTGSMVGSLFLRSYERSERIYAAMLARGFEGEFRHMHSRATRPAELVALAAVVCWSIFLVVTPHLWPQR
jgi:cobalt/nickel transport system permease protein